MTRKSMNRREFLAEPLKITLGAAGLSVLCLTCDKEKKPVEPKPAGETVAIDLNDPAYSDLSVPGGAVILEVPNIEGPVLVIRIDENSVSALSAVCTHRGCTVNLPEEGRILCPCHGSSFSLTGEVLSGPATDPLPRIDARLEDDRIVLDY